MGKLKDVIFLGGKQFQIYNCTQEQRSALGGEKGPVRAPFPQLTKRDGEGAAYHISALSAENLPSRDSG